VTIQLAPNDPKYTNGSLWGLDKIQAPAAWNTTTGSTAVVVAVIDTGVDYTHPDLNLNIWINQGELLSGLTDVDGNGLITFWDLKQTANASFVDDWNGNGYIDAGDLLDNRSDWENGVDSDGNGYIDDLVGWDFVNNDNNPLDDNSHGTHVSGTIGAMGDNGTGVAGVNWVTSMAALKFLSASGSGSISNAVKALDYAVGNGMRLTNNSWGGGGYSSTLYSAINNALNADQLFVAAAGNSGSNNDQFASYPASYNLANVIAVAATDNRD